MKTKIHIEESRKVDKLFSTFKTMTKLSSYEIGRKTSIGERRLSRLNLGTIRWLVEDIVKLDQAFPYWRDLIKKPSTLAQGSSCPDCGSNKSTVERTSSESARGVGREDVILERTRKCATPNCKQRWRTYEISKERFEEIAAKSLE